MFGTTAGFVALGLLVFDPTLLAHGALVTTDAIQACFLLASIYAFYCYVQSALGKPPGNHSLAVGFALASKHSAVLVFPMLVMLAGIEVFRRRSADMGSQHSIGKRTARLRCCSADHRSDFSRNSVGTYGFRYFGTRKTN